MECRLGVIMAFALYGVFFVCLPFLIAFRSQIRCVHARETLSLGSDWRDLPSFMLSYNRSHPANKFCSH